MSIHSTGRRVSLTPVVTPVRVAETHRSTHAAIAQSTELRIEHDLDVDHQRHLSSTWITNGNALY